MQSHWALRLRQRSRPVCKMERSSTLCQTHASPAQCMPWYENHLIVIIKKIAFNSNSFKIFNQVNVYQYVIPFFIALPHFHWQWEHVSAFFSASRQSFTWSFSVLVNGKLFGSNVLPLSVFPLFDSCSSMRHSPRLFMQLVLKSLICSWKNSKIRFAKWVCTINKLSPSLIAGIPST